MVELIIAGLVHAKAKLDDLCCKAKASYKVQRERASIKKLAPPAVAACIAATPAVQAAVEPEFDAVPEQATCEEAGKAIQVADATYLVTYNSSWSVTLREYSAAATVTRSLRCTDPMLIGKFKAAFGQSTVEMSPVSLKDTTIEEVISATEGDGLEMLEMAIRKMEVNDENAIVFALVPPVYQQMGDDLTERDVPKGMIVKGKSKTKSRTPAKPRSKAQEKVKVEEAQPTAPKVVMPSLVSPYRLLAMDLVRQSDAMGMRPGVFLGVMATRNSVQNVSVKRDTMHLKREPIL